VICTQRRCGLVKFMSSCRSSDVAERSKRSMNARILGHVAHM